MHSLFWKIFLSFWGTLILFALATLLTMNLFLEHKREQQGQFSPREYLQRQAREAQSIADRQGEEGLRRWLKAVDRHEVVPLLLVNAAGEDLLGRDVPENLHAWLLRSPRLEREESRRRMRVVAAVIRLPDGTEYRLVPDIHNVTLARVLARPRVLALPLLLAALVSGAVCLLLARYLTRPLTQLHAATEAYARGDLAVRVAPALGGRRDEIAALALAFDRMAARLAELLHSHKQLLRDVSHELRSPLARLQVGLELARTRTGDTATRELDRIALEAERLDEMIGQLLSLARLEAQTGPAVRESVDLRALLADVVEDARFEARGEHRDIGVSDGEALSVNGDPALLHSALENIVRNAVRHTAENTAIDITLARDSERRGFLRLEVRDHGPGVPEAMLARLFEPFVRVDNARSRDQGGAGLGLAIAQRAIRLHGGELTAENAAGGGLRVRLQLPLTG
jgi:two-component system, OmpR family, sensor histidine kinase CpxA